MPSPAESLAASMNLAAFSKATELKSRIGFTLMALIVYRIGTYIPMPGIDPVTLGELFKQHGGGILGMFDMFSGGALKRMTIFALSVMPYITASIIVQLAVGHSAAFRSAQERRRAGAHEAQPVFALSDGFFAIVQSYALAVGLENMMGGGSAVIISGHCSSASARWSTLDRRHRCS